MAKVSAERLAAEIDGSFVVFLIGMRINKFWKPHKWVPFALAMPRMIKELEAAPEDYGFLGYQGFGKSMVQYWRSFDQLEHYARAKDAAHWPAWLDFNKRFKNSRGDVGIWHETYVVEAGRYEAVYSGMPPVGLGKAGELVPATGNREEARARMSS